MDAGMQVALPILGVKSFRDLEESEDGGKANLHGKKYKCCCLSFMWKASKVRDDDQMIVPMLYLALWQVKLLLGFDETKYTNWNDIEKISVALCKDDRHKPEIITRRILVQFDRNITQLVVHFLTLKVELNWIKWDADSGGYTQTYI
ncbi:hypothetical protein NC651_014927 [Populus alba x Populus x berolinensis]|nr:hypothetical protein NC651_014927 [Populus alba x Populus x berolinensis]